MPPEASLPLARENPIARIPAVWCGPLARLALAWLALMLLTAREWLTMVEKWWTISTYNHVLFVPPIIGWLVWNRRRELTELVPRAWWPGLVLLAGALFLWLLGTLASFNSASQLGAVLALQAAVVAMLGPRVAAGLLFPLGYMLFLVPFGDELVPALQMITADIVIRLTHLSGIPAVIDGVFIDTPAGLFEVAEACSGVQFLVAMLALGVLIAQTCFRGWRRRACLRRCRSPARRATPAAWTPAPATAARGLDDHGIADIGRDPPRFVIVGDGAVGAGDQRQAQRARGPLGLDLVAHRADVLGLGADPGDVVRLDDLGELGVLAEEPVAGVDRIGVRDLGGRDDRRDVEVAFGRGRRADADRVIGQPHVHRVGIGGRVHRDRLDPHFVRGAVDAQRDLAAVGDQYPRNSHQAVPPVAGAFVTEPILAKREERGWSNDASL